jgi:hypothetical protein
MYEVKTEYGNSYIINKSHILTVYNKVSKKVIDMKLEEYLKFDKVIRQRFLMISNHVSIEWEFKDNGVDLYLMGTGMKLLREYIINDRESRLLLLGGFVDFYCTINSLGYYDIDSSITEDNIEIINASNKEIQKKDFVIVNYDILDKFNAILKSFQFKSIIIDESHKVKNKIPVEITED